MLRMKKQGFTLIELMVVIVIIGVLASLAIPRFTEASAKAKAAEAPRVTASYESAYLAAIAELPGDSVTAGIPLSDLIFESPKDSKWWTYDTLQTAKELKATASSSGMGAMSGVILATKYDPAKTSECFTHSATGTDAVKAVKKMLPNFINTCPSTNIK